MRKSLLLIMLAICTLLAGCEKNEKENNIKEDDIMMNVVINNNTYNVSLENNSTVLEFIKLLPLELNMEELNGNEKYYYLDSKLPINYYDSNKIEKGDIMLFGDNCIVLFYKSFNTSYRYTKLGHIDNLEELDDSNITIKFEKAI